MQAKSYQDFYDYQELGRKLRKNVATGALTEGTPKTFFVDFKTKELIAYHEHDYKPTLSRFQTQPKGGLLDSFFERLTSK